MKNNIVSGQCTKLTQANGNIVFYSKNKNALYAVGSSSSHYKKKSRINNIIRSVAAIAIKIISPCPCG